MQRLCVVGGDERALGLKPLLAQAGYQVDALGLEKGDDMRAEPARADAILLPYPFSARDGRVPTLTGISLSVAAILLAARPGATLLLGGGMEQELKRDDISDKAFRIKRYADCDAFLQTNAELSAEAAVYETMKRLDIALTDAAVLVTGYGRFGRATAIRLRSLGARVWVGARREAQRLQAVGDGMNAVPLEALQAETPYVDALLNTVPAHILSRSLLEKLPKQAPVLELASAPYGAEPDAARAIGLRYDILPALPARYAPMSAAKALMDACTRLLTEA